MLKLFTMIFLRILLNLVMFGGQTSNNINDVRRSALENAMVSSCVLVNFTSSFYSKLTWDVRKRWMTIYKGLMSVYDSI